MKHKREAENRSRRPAAGWLILLAVVIIAAVVCTAILVRKAPLFLSIRAKDSFLP